MWARSDGRSSPHYDVALRFCAKCGALGRVNGQGVIKSLDEVVLRSKPTYADEHEVIPQRHCTLLRVVSTAPIQRVTVGIEIVAVTDLSGVWALIRPCRVLPGERIVIQAQTKLGPIVFVGEHE
jgi:hypothetical protein